MKLYPFLCLFILCILSSGCNEAKNNPDKASSSPEKSTNKAKKAAENIKTTKTIVFFGNSLTAAYGLKPEQGFAGLTQQKIDELGLDYKVVNAGISGETTAGGNSRINWVLKQPIDIFILELGGNDALRGIDPEDSYNNLKSILESVQKKYPQAKLLIAGMEAPPNMGSDFTSAFRKIYTRLAKEFNAALIPFLLEGVGGEKELNLPDGIHPNIEGHKIVVENVWKELKNLL